MRVHRLWEGIPRTADRSPARRRLWTVTLAAFGALIGLRVPSFAAEPPAANKADQLSPASATACFAILGEVARPGVYELPAACTFGQLVRQAGGMTAEADGNARVLRGVRVVQQLYVASSESVALSPRDLIIIERGAGLRSAESRRRSRGAAVPPVAEAAVEQVQIGLVNLVDRPVVMTFAREQASPERILECLRQPAELLAEVQVVASDRHAPSLAGAEANFGGELLSSGTVLIFPVRRVQLASLPPLPEPIAAVQPGSPSDSSPNDASATAHSAVGTSGLATDSPEPVTASKCAPAGTCSASMPDMPVFAGPTLRHDRLVYGAAAMRGSELAQMGSPYRNVGPEEWERSRLLAAEREHARPYLFLGVMAGTAVAAILLTIGSMSLRALNTGRPADSNAALEAVPGAPALSEPVGECRPIRVDANLSQTRLGLDLAVLERVRARQTANGTPLSDPTPKAA